MHTASTHSPAAPSGAQRPLDITLGTVQRVLDVFPLAISVCVGGSGEPLLHPDIFEVLRLVRQRHMQTAVVTNGTLLPGKVDEVLRASVGFMNVSFYGVDGETFARRTGARPSLFDDMLQAVAELARRRSGRRGPGLLRGSFVCTKENLDEAIAFVALCEKLGLDQAKLSNLTYYGVAGNDGSLSLHENDPEAQAFIARLRRMTHRIPVVLPRLYGRAHVSRRCHLPFKELVADGNGSTAPCCVEGPFLGRTGVFTDPHAWNSPEMVARRRALTDPARPLPTACRQCDKLM